MSDTSAARVFWEAARPRTLPAAVAPVLAGTAAAERFGAGRFLGALVVALAVQVGVNYANDYFDARSGVDRADRVGPRRAVASGLVTPAAMRRAMLAAFAVTAAAGLALAAIAGWELLLVGAACLLAAVGYSGGPKPYASAGLGELFVFVFFGVVATAGSAYVQDEALRLLPLTAALPMGLLASAILVANNLRDVATDRAAGKITLAVRLGPERTRTVYTALALGAPATVPLIAWVAGSPWPLLGLAATPLLAAPIRTVRHGSTPLELIGALGGTARAELALGVLLAAGLWAR